MPWRSWRIGRHPSPRGTSPSRVKIDRRRIDRHLRDRIGATLVGVKARSASGPAGGGVVFLGEVEDPAAGNAEHQLAPLISSFIIWWVT